MGASGAGGRALLACYTQEVWRQRSTSSGCVSAALTLQSRAATSRVASLARGPVVVCLSTLQAGSPAAFLSESRHSLPVPSPELRTHDGSRWGRAGWVALQGRLGAGVALEGLAVTTYPVASRSGLVG